MFESESLYSLASPFLAEHARCAVYKLSGSLFKSPVITIDFSSDKRKIILFGFVTNLI